MLNITGKVSGDYDKENLCKLAENGRVPELPESGRKSCTFQRTNDVDIV